MAKLIQLITSKTKHAKFPHLSVAEFISPRSLDEFDINIIDLSDKWLWFNNGNSKDTVNQAKNLCSVCEMVKQSRSSIVIYVLPQNLTFNYNKSRADNCYLGSLLLKDNLSNLSIILSKAIPNIFSDNTLYSQAHFKLCYENTRTSLNGKEWEAAFHFTIDSGLYSSITKSQKSEKSTTIKDYKNTYLTTLNVTETEEDLLLFVQALFPEDNESKPEWLDDVFFCDDLQQREIITANHQVIEDANKAISDAQAKLDENNRYKSILYTQGEELSRVVVSILESLLQCDLSAFEDNKYEDFLIQKEDVTFVGEIKGVSSNVKNDNIGQIEHHCQQYNDLLEENGREENVRALLIINPFRSKNPADREPVHDRQINLAKRNGCLIIETITLLRVFEAYKQGSITSDKCIEVFSSHTGLLNMSDFN